MVSRDLVVELRSQYVTARAPLGKCDAPAPGKLGRVPQAQSLATSSNERLGNIHDESKSRDRGNTTGQDGWWYSSACWNNMADNCECSGRVGDMLDVGHFAKIS